MKRHPPQIMQEGEKALQFYGGWKEGRKDLPKKEGYAGVGGYRGRCSNPYPTEGGYPAEY